MATSSSVHCAVISVDSPIGERRMATLRAQLAHPEFGLPWELHRYTGPTPASPELQAWKGAGPRVYGEVEVASMPHLLNCVGVLRSFLKQSADDVLLLLEDDVAFVRGARQLLPSAIAQWRAACPESHALRIGYLPCISPVPLTCAAQLYPASAHALPLSCPEDGARCSEEEARRRVIVSPGPFAFKVMGVQATAFDRVGAAALLRMLEPSHVEAKRALDESAPPPASWYAHGWPVVFDHTVNHPALAAAFLVPPMARETGETGSTCGSNNSWAAQDALDPLTAAACFNPQRNLARGAAS